MELLQDDQYANVITWVGSNWEFKLLDPETVSMLWGIRKRKPSMNYDKLSRAIRYYYDKKIIHKVHGKRYQYRFNYETISKFLNSLDHQCNAAETAASSLEKSYALVQHAKEDHCNETVDLIPRRSSASRSPSPHDSVAQALEQQLIAQQSNDGQRGYSYEQLSTHSAKLRVFHTSSTH